MFWKALRVVLAVCVLEFLFVGFGHAQDFSTLVQEAATANQQWLSAIDTASQATDLATLKAEAAAALAIGERTQSLLQQALPLAPDDATRSRISGLLAHVNNAVDAGRRVASETTLSAAQSDLNAERAEANEARTEIATFLQTVTPAATSTTVPTAVATALPSTATPVPTPTLPQAGGTPLGAVIALGLLGVLAGIGLRRNAA